MTTNSVASRQAGAGASARRPVKAVLFDVDGTLCDSYRLGFEATNAVFAQQGAIRGPCTEAEYHTATIYPTPARFAFHVTGDSVDSTGIGAELGKLFDAHYIDLISLSTAALFPQIREMLVNVQRHQREGDEKDCYSSTSSSSSGSSRIRYGALSNACGAYVRALAALHDLEAEAAPVFFDIMWGADDVPAAKPSGAGLLQMCCELGLDPADCLYVGDAPSDGSAARSAGMLGIGVTWGSHAAAAVQPAFDEVVTSVSELERRLLFHTSSAM